MRIWDLPPSRLCRNHLLGEHRELHALWSILTANRKGYSQHPETQRWIGKNRALFARHTALVEEMQKRGYKHHSPLEQKLAVGEARQTTFVNSLAEQSERLKNKGCGCRV